MTFEFDSEGFLTDRRGALEAEIDGAHRELFARARQINRDCHDLLFAADIRKVIERLAAHSGEELSVEEFDDADLEELGSELFYSWFSHYEYVTALAELRPLIPRAAVAESVSQLVGQVKGCYAFQQYDAAYALCRMVIEASVRDICVRRRLFPDLGDNVVLFEEHKWHKLRDKVSSGPLRERLRILYADLSAVIHSRKSVTKEEAHRAYEETLQIVEQLYAENGL